MKPHILRRLINKIGRATYELQHDANRLAGAGYECEAEGLRAAVKVMGNARRSLEDRESISSKGV